MIHNEAERVGTVLLGLLDASLGGYVLVRRGRGHRAKGEREWRVNVRQVGGRETIAAGRDLVDVLTRALDGVRTMRAEVAGPVHAKQKTP